MVPGKSKRALAAAILRSARVFAARALPVFALVAAGCEGSAGPGALTILLEPEDTITGGLTGGSAADDVVDGWNVSFTKYVVSVGDVVVARSGDGESHAYPTVHVVDLGALGTTGYVLVDEPSLASGRWDHVSYGLVAPSADTSRDPNVDEADFATMVAGGCTYLVEGTLTKSGGESCPPGGTCRAASAIDFGFCVPAVQEFIECGSEQGLPGLVVNAGASVSVALTLHGDHLFFDRFPAGTEIVNRRAQWLADSDVNADGLVDRAELESIDTPSELSAVFPSAEYNLGSSPNPIDTVFDFVVAQLRTQGHFQGEGECAFPAN